MRAIYVERNIPRVILTKALAPVWRDVYFSRLSPLQVGDIAAALPGPRWVRVENRLAGICGTDLVLVYADVDLRVAPLALPSHARRYLGHEIVGYVTEVGPAVTTLKVGDRVALQFNLGCCLSEEIEPPCRFCAAGQAYLCENMAECHSAPIGGGWGEGFLAHEALLYRVPDSLTEEQAVLLEPTAVGVHAALRRPPAPRERVLVLGCGIIGLLTLQAVRAIAPEADITAIARYPHQAEAARRLGADQVLMGAEATYDRVAELTQARFYQGPLGNKMLMGGFDVVYDCVGKARTIEDALRWTRAGGTVVVIGIDLNRLKLDLTPVWYSEVDLIGSLAFGMEEWEGEQVATFDLVARWFAEGKLTADGLITHRYALSEYQAAIATATDKSRQSIKVVFAY